MATSSDADETEFDAEHAAEEWLRALIAAGHITPEPTSEEISEIARVIGPALRRVVQRKEPAA